METVVADLMTSPAVTCTTADTLAHAAHLMQEADTGSVIVTDDFHAAVNDAASGGGPGVEFEFLALRPRRVKDVGRIQLWVLHRPGADPVALDRRMGGRFERIAEVFHDLDELREKGERLIAGARSAGGAEGGDPEGSEVE